MLSHTTPLVENLDLLSLKYVSICRVFYIAPFAKTFHQTLAICPPLIDFMHGAESPIAVVSHEQSQLWFQTK